LGVQFAQFLLDDGFSPDFVVDDQYRETCIRYFFEYLFKTLNCQFVTFNLPPESQNLAIMRQLCKVHGIGFSAGTRYEHRIIPVECSWDEFQKRKGRRRIIRQIERKLDEIGSWEIEYFENLSKCSDILNKILDVERLSWKHPLSQSNACASFVFENERLLTIWAASQTAARTNDFKWSVWFLQINDKTVAYTFAVKYKETAFIATTSYDEQYRKSYVGKYINAISIRDMFNDGHTKIIDFTGDFSFMSFWTSLSLSNVRVCMCKKNLVPLVKRLSSNTYMLRVSSDILSKTRLFKEFYSIFDLIGGNDFASKNSKLNS